MINKAINYILSNDDPVKLLVKTRIFAVVAPEKTLAPLIVFSRTVKPVYTKSGLEHDQSFVTILIFSKIYAESIDVMKAVRVALEFKKGNFAGVEIGDARVT
ncbi:unnamed protein product, partial [marine sediment metagenome]